jgi:dATP pyrophosphohydrolase
VKLPLSVLVVVHTASREVLLLERASRAGFWQSVTGSLDRLDEPLAVAAAREVAEETGIDASAYSLTDWNLRNVYAIYPVWRHRYAPGVMHNTEHVFGLRVPGTIAVRVAPGEHLGAIWLPWREAAEKVFSWSNRQAIEMLPGRNDRGTTRDP